MIIIKIMNIKSFSFVIILVMSFYYSYSQTSPDEIKEIISNSLAGGNMTVYYKKSKIPRVLRKSLAEEFGGNFRIANPNKQYRKTDVVRNPFLPTRQMVFLITINNYYLFVFKQGGRGHSTYFVFSEVVNNTVSQINMFNVRNSITALPDLIQAIELNKIYPIE